MSYDIHKLRQEVIRYLGMGDTLSDLSSDDRRRVDSIIDSGVNRFYNPPVMEGQKEAHLWSFLNPVGILELEAGEHTKTLPDDFGQVTDGWTVEASRGSNTLSRVTDSHLRAVRSRKANKNGIPEIFAIRPRAATAGAREQQFDVVFYPTPDEDMIVEYQYRKSPPKLSVENPYPLGGKIHADTLLAAVLSVAQEREKDTRGEQYAEFLNRLAASVQIDMAVTDATPISYDMDIPVGSYEWLAQEVGRVTGNGTNPYGFNSVQAAVVDNFIQRGLQMFYTPIQTGRRNQKTHRWTFLYPTYQIETQVAYSTGTIAVTDGVVTLTSGTFPSWAEQGVINVAGSRYEVLTLDSGTQVTVNDETLDVTAGTSYTLERWVYDLPADWGGAVGPMTYQPGASTYYPPVRYVPETDLRIEYQRSDASDRPLVYSTRAKAQDKKQGTEWVLLLWPPPTTQLILEVRYRSNPTLTRLKPGEFPMGHEEHYETILAGCLAATEDGVGGRTQRFMELLAAAIEFDRNNHQPETFGVVGDGPGLMFDSYDRTLGLNVSYDTTSL